MGEREVDNNNDVVRVFADVLHWRPTLGAATDGYWALRRWCEDNNYNISELFNALIPVIAYYALNFTVDTGEEDKYGKVLGIHLNAGTIPIKRPQTRTGRQPTHKMIDVRRRTAL